MNIIEAIDPYNFIGAIGALLIVFGVYRTSIGKWSRHSLWYELDTLVGASCIIVYQINKKAYITMIVNVVWVIVALKGVTSIAERSAKKRLRHKQ